MKFEKEFRLIIVLLLLVAAFGLLSPSFLTLRNISNILVQNSVIGLVSLGMTLVVISGGIDLSVGSIVALSSMAFALLLANGVSLVVASLCCIICGATLGLITGSVIAFLKIPAFVATLGMMSVLRGGALLINGSNSISISENYVFNVYDSSIAGIPIIFLIFLLFTALLWVLTRKTIGGLKLYAIGNNLKAAYFNGINVRFYTIIAYVGSGFCSAVAAILLVSQLNSAQPQSGQLYELTAIAGAVVGGANLSGGKGSMFGTFLGILILGTIQNGLYILNVPSFYQYIVIGVIIITFVSFNNKIYFKK